MLCMMTICELQRLCLEAWTAAGMGGRLGTWSEERISNWFWTSALSSQWQMDRALGLDVGFYSGSLKVLRYIQQHVPGSLSEKVRASALDLFKAVL